MGTYQTVLVGTDGSESSYRAVERAAEIAHDVGARLAVVCAYHPAPQRAVDAAADELGEVAYQVVGSNPAEEALRTATELADKKRVGNVVTEAVVGDPVKSIRAAIENYQADLVVIGNRGLNSLAGRILGSVPSEISRHASTDVLIVYTTSGR